MDTDAQGHQRIRPDVKDLRSQSEERVSEGDSYECGKKCCI